MEANSSSMVAGLLIKLEQGFFGRVGRRK